MVLHRDLRGVDAAKVGGRRRCERLELRRRDPLDAEVIKDGLAALTHATPADDGDGERAQRGRRALVADAIADLAERGVEFVERGMREGTGQVDER